MKKRTKSLTNILEYNSEQDKSSSNSMNLTIEI